MALWRWYQYLLYPISNLHSFTSLLIQLISIPTTLITRHWITMVRLYLNIKSQLRSSYYLPPLLLFCYRGVLNLLCVNWLTSPLLHYSHFLIKFSLELYLINHQELPATHPRNWWATIGFALYVYDHPLNRRIYHRMSRLFVCTSDRIIFESSTWPNCAAIVTKGLFLICNSNHNHVPTLCTPFDCLLHAPWTIAFSVRPNNNSVYIM